MENDTFIGDLRLSGMSAPMVLDGPMTGAWFAVYAEHILPPPLKTGDIIVLDNLTAHRNPDAKTAIEAVGATMMFLAPYSPDFDPFENAFSKLKSLLRKAATPNNQWPVGRHLRRNRNLLTRRMRQLICCCRT